MTAESDIAAIATGEQNTALEVRTALTSVLAATPEWVQYLGRRLPGETPHTDDDFFDNGVVPGVSVEPEASKVAWSESFGRLSLRITANTASSDVYARAIPLTPNAAPAYVETHFVTYATSTSNSTGIFVGFSDGTTAASNIAGWAMYYASGWALTRASGTFTSTSLPDSVRPIQWPGLGAYWRVIWVSANTFRLQFSPDGVSWVRGAADLSTSVAPSHIAMGGWGLAGGGVTGFDYLRVGEVDPS